jgi:alkylhydroperoxidase/carboxymuconolactone decarboxylase family protein YurZ
MPTMQTTSELYEKGKEVRIAVLGEAHVSKALASRQSEFAQPLQLFTTEYAWGRVWSRPELDRRSRSLISMCNTHCKTAQCSTFLNQ